MASIVEPTLPESYFALVRRFPLTRIRDAAHLAHAQAVLDDLLRQDLDAGGEAYLDALSDLVELHEAEHEPQADVAPEDVLRELVDASGLTQQRLARAVGIAQSTLSAALCGRRRLTTDHITRLARYFGVPPAVFLPGPEGGRSAR